MENEFILLLLFHFLSAAELLALMNPGLFGVPSNVDPMAVKALFSQYKQPGPLPFARKYFQEFAVSLNSRALTHYTEFN